MSSKRGCGEAPLKSLLELFGRRRSPLQYRWKETGGSPLKPLLPEWLTMSKQDDLHNKIVVFLTRSRKIQDAPGEQRNRWLRDAELARYIAEAKLNPADGASEFSNKIIAALWNHRTDLLAFLQHIAEGVYERGAQGGEEYGELVELINIIVSKHSDVTETGHWGM